MNTDNTAGPLTPDPNNLTPLDAFYHIFTVDKHEYESEEEYKERLVARDTFVKTIEDAGMTPAAYLQQLQARYGNN